MKRTLSMLAVLLMIAATGFAQKTYKLVNTASELEAGKSYIFIGENNGTYYAMGKQSNNNRSSADLIITPNDGKITLSPASETDVTTAAYEFVLGGSTGAWTFFDPVYNGYLYAASSDANYLRTQETNDDNGLWSITALGGGLDSIVAQGTNTRNIMRFNSNNTLFSCYAATSSVITNVSLYKEQDDIDVLPEPSNHVTNFVATNNMLDITLTWTDATGAQLPTSYLIMGWSDAAPATVTDGTPIATNTANLIANVAYGEEEYTFTDLTPNTPYKFQIYPYTNSGNIIDYKTDGNVPLANITIENVSILLYEPFDNDLGVFTAYNVEGDQVWAHGTHNNDNYASMSGYDGSSNANEDWLISPAINGNTPKVVLQFSTAKNYSGDPLKLMISTNYNATAGPETATWTDITDMFEWSTGSFNWKESGAVNITDYVDETFHIAFVYTSTSENSSTWEIDYVRILAADIDGVADNTSSSVVIFPNPASQEINIMAETDATAYIYDAIGRIVASANVTKGHNTIDIQNLENGLYFVKINNSVTKVLKH